MKPFLSRHLSPRVAIGVAVLALLVSIVSGREKPDTLAHAAPAAQRPAPAAHAGESLDPGKLRRAPNDEAVGDLFPAPRVRAPGNAPPVQAEAPTAPVAPPLPFRYLGKAVEGGTITVFLGRGDEHYRVTKGDRIGREYRVDRVTEKTVAFTYLPLAAHQTLPLPSSEPIVIQ